MGEPTPEQRSLLQFSLRSLLVAAVVVAVPAAAAAPWVRTLQNDQLLRLAAALALTLLITAVSIVITCSRRWVLVQETGKLLMRVSTARRFWYHFGYLLVIVVAFLVWLDNSYFWVISATPPRAITSKSSLDITDWLNLVILCVCLVQMVTFYVVYVVWWRIDPTTVEIREKGLLVRGRRVVAWTSIASHRWKSTGPADLMLQLPSEVVSLRLLPRDKEAVDRLIDEMCAKQDQPPEPETAPTRPAGKQVSNHCRCTRK